MEQIYILLLLLWGNAEFTLTNQVCSQLPTVERAFVSDEYRKAQYQEGDVIYFSCDPGYITAFNESYICTEFGWKATTYGQCHEVGLYPLLLGCLPPRPPQNGRLLYNSSYFYADGDRAQIICDPAHRMIGMPFKTCSNGQWTGDIRCQSTFCSKPPLENFEVEGEKTEYITGEVLTYRCNQGYLKVNELPSQCTDMGDSVRWIPVPRCERIFCKLSFLTPVGTLYSPRYQTIFLPGQLVMVSCTEKHWVKNKMLQSAELTCLETGEWDFNPVCQMVTCEKVADNVNWWGQRVPSWHHLVNIDETVQYQCHGGYKETNPTKTATCTRQGLEPDPLCTALLGCGSPPSLENGEFLTNATEFDHDTTVKYRCHAMYTMLGKPYKTCVNGKWIGEASCLKPCTLDQALMEANKIQPKYTSLAKLYVLPNDHLTFQCVAGATHDGAVEMRPRCVDGEMLLPTCV